MTPSIPTTLAFLLCDDIRPPLGPAADLVGLHQAVAATAVPSMRLELCVYWLVTGIAPGRHQFGLVLTDPADRPIWPPTPVEFDVKVTDPRSEVEWAARVHQIAFPEYGEYHWQMRTNGVTVAERRYLVVPAPHLAAGPTSAPSRRPRRRDRTGRY
jgi:hypothetical protein